MIHLSELNGGIEWHSLLHSSSWWMIKVLMTFGLEAGRWVVRQWLGIGLS